MYKLITFLLVLSFYAGAQTKKPVQKKPVKTVQDSVPPDTLADAEETTPIPREFMVYTKRPGKKEKRMKLCLNLVNGDSIFNYCMNDSVLRDPHVTKILFEKKNADSTYVLVYADAFSKPKEKPSCDAGHERKLFFVRLSNTTNKAIVKQKYIESCMKNVTKMSKDDITEWDGNSILTVSYYRGGINFMELKFDPQNYLLGMQSTNDLDGK